MDDNSNSAGSATPSLAEIPAPSAVGGSAQAVQFGIPRPPQQQVLLYSPDEWEQFIREWVHCLKQAGYVKVLRLAGPGDMGIDVAAFTDDQGLFGVWDNYQCKHYDHPLEPGEGAKEVAKVLWHSFEKRYRPPRRYFFVAPQECGIGLSKMLSTPGALRAYVISNWDKFADAVTKTQTIQLSGDFKTYVENFDYSIFGPRTLLEIVDQHRGTPYHAVRFGGGLPQRPAVAPPLFRDEESESRYVKQLFEAYSDHTGADVTGLNGLASHLTEHFHRQREFFYHAEALRNFARDTVPTGTFEDLQTEVHAGVADVEGAAHTDSLARVNAVTLAASGLQLTSNALISVVKVQDRKGICHQLANDDRLRWRKS